MARGGVGAFLCAGGGGAPGVCGWGGGGGGGVEPVADAQVVHARFYERERVGRVDYVEVGGVAQVRDVLAQYPRARGVERRDPHPARRADKLLHPAQHLPRRLVRERDREDLVRADALLFYQVCDAVGYGLGLAASGARQDEE